MQFTYKFPIKLEIKSYICREFNVKQKNTCGVPLRIASQAYSKQYKC